jgi:hypothetical protein
LEEYLIKFQRGVTGLHRELTEQSEISHVKPGTVVEDSESKFVLWTPVGTPVLYAESMQSITDGSRRWDESWQLTESIWRSEVLSIFRPGKIGKTELKWDNGRVFQGWKVSLVSRGRRTLLGCDTYPYQLAVVIAPDGTWHYKNEKELDYAVEIGRLTQEERDAIRAEGECIVSELDDIVAVCPDDRIKSFENLGHPTLPANWDDLTMYGDAPNSRDWTSDLFPT